MKKHKLELSRMPGLARLRCEPCKFYAALVDGATEAETERLVRDAALRHLTAADPNDPFALSFVEQLELERFERFLWRASDIKFTPPPVKYKPLDPALAKVFSGTKLYERPELTRLRDDMKTGVFQIVIAHAIDRLSREQTRPSQRRTQ